MKLSKQRKVYAGVLGMALAALVGDRIFLGGRGLSPQAATASGFEIADAAALSVGEQPPPVSARSGVRTLARSLDTMRRQSVSFAIQRSEQGSSDPRMFGAVRDWKLRLIPGELATSRPRAGLFGGEAAWLAPRAVARAEVAAAAPEAPREMLSDVLARHRITGVVFDSAKGKDSFVVVDGRLLRVGGTFDGITVEKVEMGSATFARHNERKQIDFVSGERPITRPKRDPSGVSRSFPGNARGITLDALK